MNIWPLLPLHFILQIFTPYLHQSHETTYSKRFTEKKSLGRTAHPYNAISSLIYVCIFINHVSEHTTISLLNLIFGIVSYLYHATENPIIGEIDITLVFANKLAFMFIQTNQTYMTLSIVTFLCIMFWNLYVNRYTIDRYIGNQYETMFLSPLTVGIFLTMNGSFKPYIIFVVGYIFKFMDKYLVSRNIHYSNPLQGTAIYHLLTGVSMMMKLSEN